MKGVSVLNSALSTVLHSNFYLAFGAALTLFPVSKVIGFYPELKIFFVLFLGTFSLYTFNRYLELEEDKHTYPERTEFIKSSKKLFFLTFSSYFVCLFFSFILGGLIPFSIILFISVIMFFYSKEFFKIRLKKLFITKNIIISSCWAIALVFLPASFIDLNYISWHTVLPVSLVIFVTTFVNTVIFDMRDMKGDKKNGIKTIPTQYGLTKTRQILFLLNAFCLIFLFTFLIFLRYSLSDFIILMFPGLYIYAPLFLSKKWNLTVVADLLGDAWLILFGLVGILF